MKSISDYYAADHDRLDGLFKTYQQLKRSDFSKAKEAFVGFKFGLQRHIIWEEDILFPLFEKKTGMNPNMGPTAVMRTEHRQIKTALEAIHTQVAKGSPETDRDEKTLLTVLTEHNVKEENILYPAIDRLVTEAETAEIFQKMETVPRERYEECC